MQHLWAISMCNMICNVFSHKLVKLEESFLVLGACWQAYATQWEASKSPFRFNSGKIKCSSSGFHFSTNTSYLFRFFQSWQLVWCMGTNRTSRACGWLAGATGSLISSLGLVVMYQSSYRHPQGRTLSDEALHVMPSMLPATTLQCKALFGSPLPC